MDPVARATVLDFHRHRIGVFGRGSVESLGWRDARSQQQRFEVIASACDINGASVLDVGCGQGDLKGFLDERFSGFSYLGLEHVSAFVEQACAAWAHCPDTTFVQCDFSAVQLPVVDCVIASGALGYRCADPDFHLAMIRRMYAAARRTLVFNLLDADVFPDHPLLVGRDRAEVVALCRSLSPAVEVIDGYLDDDFTICVRRVHGRATGPHRPDSPETHP
jgi:SAM-dependent methyltransferase